ncbi:CDP-alcohol phosphatidyltransferase family protein [bacterium]|nr:CDP-alcohol phosphatidyltransferase family protein [bacterium]
MIPEYRYCVEDKSIMTPFFRERIARPLLVFVPRAIPANIITIISNIFMFIAFFLAFHFGRSLKINFIIIPTLFFLYLLFDHFDGMQAKRTKTSSALGEFFDHFMDTLNNGILLGTFLLLFEFQNIFIISMVIGFSYLVHASVFFEQFKTKKLIFEKIGSFEGVVLTISVVALGYFESFHDLMNKKVYGNLMIIHLFLLFIVLSEFITFLGTIIRIKKINFKIMAFTASQLIIIACSTLSIKDRLYVIIIVSLYGILYIGGLMKGHLADTIERHPDYITPILLILLHFSILFKCENWIIYIITYLTIRILYLAITTIYILREFWVWVNPKLEK